MRYKTEKWLKNYKNREKTPRHKNEVKKAICQNILINICENEESNPYKSRATESKGRNGI